MPLNYASEYYSDPSNPYPKAPEPFPTGDAAANADFTVMPGQGRTQPPPPRPSRQEAQTAFDAWSKPDYSPLGILGMLLKLPVSIPVGIDQELRGLTGGRTIEGTADEYRDIFDTTRSARNQISDYNVVEDHTRYPGESLWGSITGSSREATDAGEKLMRLLRANEATRQATYKDIGTEQTLRKGAIEGAKGALDFKVAAQYASDTAQAKLAKLKADLGRTGILNSLTRQQTMKTIEDRIRLGIATQEERLKLKALQGEDTANQDLQTQFGTTGFAENLGMPDALAEVARNHPNLGPVILKALPEARAAVEARGTARDESGVPRNLVPELHAKQGVAQEGKLWDQEHGFVPETQLTDEQIRNRERIRLEEQLAAYKQRMEYNKTQGIGTGNRESFDEFAQKHDYTSDLSAEAKARQAHLSAWAGSKSVPGIQGLFERRRAGKWFETAIGGGKQGVLDEEEATKKLYDSEAITEATARAIADGTLSLAQAQAERLQPTPTPRPTRSLEPHRTDNGGQLPGHAAETMSKHDAADKLVARVMFDQQMKDSPTPNLDAGGQPVQHGTAKYERAFDWWYANKWPSARQ